MKNGRWFFVFIVAMWFAQGCGSRQEGIGTEVMDVSEAVYASGVVKARHQYEVHPRVSGIVKSIVVQEGDSVNVGDVLVELDQTLAAASTSNAQLASSFNSVPNNQDRLQEALTSINSAAAKWKSDSLLLARQQRLWAQGVGSKLELENRSLAATNSKNALEAARLRYEQLQRQVQYSDRQSATAASISSIQQSDFVLRSDIPGLVYRIYSKQGELVSPTTTVAVVGSKDEYYIELQVDEYDISQIKPGQKVYVTMDSYKGSVFEAHITQVHPLTNERTKTFTVEAQFETLPPSLYPNLTLEANILLRIKEKVATIPRSYLINEKFVKLNTGEMREVVVGLKDYVRVEVISGLASEDRIVQP